MKILSPRQIRSRPRGSTPSEATRSRHEIASQRRVLRDKRAAAPDFKNSISLVRRTIMSAGSSSTERSAVATEGGAISSIPKRRAK